MTREPEREAFDPMALTVLRNNQQQLDADGIMVGVSRQALEMAIEFIDRVEARARLGKGEVGSKLSHRDLELQARLAFEAECADSLVDLSPATKISANHDMPYADGETTVRWWGFRSGYDCGYSAALSAKPIILGAPNTEDETCQHCGHITPAGQHHSHPCSADSGHPDDAKPVDPSTGECSYGFYEIKEDGFCRLCGVGAKPVEVGEDEAVELLEKEYDSVAKTKYGAKEFCYPQALRHAYRAFVSRYNITSKE